MVHVGLRDCNIVVIQPPKDSSHQQIKEWVANASGTVSFSSNINSDTTHLVLSEKKWKEQGPLVQEALDLKQAGVRIFIVSYDWLDDSLKSRSKRGESAYSWEKLDGSTMLVKRGAEKCGGLISESKSATGLMGEVFRGATDAYESQTDKEMQRKRQEAEKIIRKAEEEAQKQEFEKYKELMNLSEIAAVFKRGVQKARNELLSDNHHIYTDSKGFTYDVSLVPTSQSPNPNDRYTLTLQIYESNTEPYTYAFNARFSGTKTLPENNIIAGIGSNFLTVFRSFRKVFKEKTGVEWSEREKGVRPRNAVFKYVKPGYGPVGEDQPAGVGVKDLKKKQPKKDLDPGLGAFDEPFEFGKNQGEVVDLEAESGGQAETNGLVNTYTNADVSMMEFLARPVEHQNQTSTGGFEFDFSHLENSGEPEFNDGALDFGNSVLGKGKEAAIQESADNDPSQHAGKFESDMFQNGQAFGAEQYGFSGAMVGAYDEFPGTFYEAEKKGEQTDAKMVDYGLNEAVKDV